MPTAIGEATESAVRGRTRDLDFERLDAESFMRSPSISVDYAIAEKTERAAVVKSDFVWSDIGSWDAVWEAQGKDAAGNVTRGDVILDDSHDCLVQTDGPLIALAGMENTMVVATEDAVMVTRRGQGQEVRKIVKKLESLGHRAATSHRKIYRPWGHYTSLARGEASQVKQIVVHPRGKLSLQKHQHRAEHWVVVSGTATVTRDADILTISANESIYIPVGTPHRLENLGAEPLIVIEVQTGLYLEEMTSSASTIFTRVGKLGETRGNRPSQCRFWSLKIIAQKHESAVILFPGGQDKPGAVTFLISERMTLAPYCQARRCPRPIVSSTPGVGVDCGVKFRAPCRDGTRNTSSSVDLSIKWRRRPSQKAITGRSGASSDVTMTRSAA